MPDALPELKLTRPPVMKQQMLIRRPAHEVFEAFVDPEITTKIWFTKSSGKLAPNAKVTWEWEMHGVGTTAKVKAFEQDRLLRVEWNDDAPTIIEWQFHPWEGDCTLVTITEVGYMGTGDETVATAIGSAGGFSFLLASAKALLEHGIQLNLVADHMPKGSEKFI